MRSRRILRAASALLLPIVAAANSNCSGDDTSRGKHGKSNDPGEGGAASTYGSPTSAAGSNGDGGAGSQATTGTSGNSTATVGSGGSPSVSGCAIFPSDNAWNVDISNFPVHENSDAFIDAIGSDEYVHPDFGTEWEGAPIGIPYVVVDASQTRVPIEFVEYPSESDPGPYPIPLNAPIEGGPDSDGDRHVIAVDTESCMLYELYRGFPEGSLWYADSGAVFDLSINDEHPLEWTSADAAGLPIFPGLARYDEVVLEGEVRHALRFTVNESQAGFIAPARHYASYSDDPDLPPMGLRIRMKSGFDCSSFSTEAQVVCTGLKKYGMIVADNGSPWYISGAPDSRWNDDALSDLKTIRGGDAFEVVYTGDVQTY